MVNFDLDSLPPFILHKILSKVATTNKVHAIRTFRLKCYQLDGMMNLAFSVDHRALVHNYLDFTREYFDRMYHMITSWALSGHWDYGKPEMFMSLLERIDPNVSYDCWCSAIIKPVFVVYIDRSRTQWKCDRYFWQCAAWGF
ncbi:hypothetical protein DY000_02020350 [Brassica cretica]|uniref:F-box domain-containing protein n=1 Tax=Brassica cretica TaxID=69181 RepID=A0ABQ7EF40_BRACR|nr:hypothetical protein DY000_02020350 [Brassica cretica]